VRFKFHKIREKGSELSHGIGTAPGPDGLRECLELIRQLLDRCLSNGQTKLTTINAYDIVMHVADATLTGGVRRSSTTAIFSVDDEDMAKAKTGNWLVENPQRGRSNNSAILLRNVTTKEQFDTLLYWTREFGEPGFLWADDLECGFNPCYEISLWAYMVQN